MLLILVTSLLSQTVFHIVIALFATDSESSVGYKVVTPCLLLLFVVTAVCTCPEEFCNPSLLSLKVSITEVTDG